MTTSPDDPPRPRDDGMTRLEAAVEVWLAWRRAPHEPVAALLDRHAELRELLEALFGLPPADAATSSADA